MIFTKGAHQNAKIQTFYCSREISPNLHSNRLLLLTSAKKVQRSYASWYWRVMQNLKKNRFVSKMRKTWWISILVLKGLQNLHFDWCLWLVPHGAEDSCKIWRKTDLWFGKWHEEFSKFSPEHPRKSKN